MTEQAPADSLCGECDCTLAPAPDDRFCRHCGHSADAHALVEPLSGQEPDVDEGASSPLDAATAVYEAGDLETALEMLHRESFEAEERADEVALHDIADVARQMAAHLSGDERGDFERLGASAERRLIRVRDAGLSERLAQAWQAVEALELDLALDLLQDELIATGSADDLEGLRQVAATSREMADVVDVGERGAFERVRAAALGRLGAQEPEAEMAQRHEGDAEGAVALPSDAPEPPLAPSPPRIEAGPALAHAGAASQAERARVGGWGPVLFLFGFIGGIVGWLTLRDHDRRRASHVLKWGFIWSAVGVVGYPVIVVAVVFVLAHHVGRANESSFVATPTDASLTPAVDTATTTAAFAAPLGDYVAQRTISGTTPDGYSETATVTVYAPAHGDAPPILPFTGRQLYSACTVDGTTDAAIPVSVELLNTTADFSTPVGIRLFLNGQPSNTIEGDVQWSTGGVCLGPTSSQADGAVYDIIWNEQIPSQTSRSDDFYLIVHNYYTPNSPAGDSSSLTGLTLSPTLELSQDGTRAVPVDEQIPISAP